MGTLHVRAVYQTSQQDKDTKTKSHLELVLADPPNEGLVLQVVHRPPAQHLLRQAGVGHLGLSLVRPEWPAGSPAVATWQVRAQLSGRQHRVSPAVSTISRPTTAVPRAATVFEPFPFQG